MIRFEKNAKTILKRILKGEELNVHNKYKEAYISYSYSMKRCIEIDYELANCFVDSNLVEISSGNIETDEENYFVVDSFKNIKSSAILNILTKDYFANLLHKTNNKPLIIRDVGQ